MLKQVIDELVSQFKKRIVHLEEIRGKEGDYEPIPSFFPEEIKEKLEKWGIKSLFSHQAKAIEAILNRENVVISTGTASGKSLCYIIPTLWYLSKEPQSTFLYLFPTKALAQDQLKKLRELDLGHLCATYDGDTPIEQRALIRQRMKIILSNPDMLHISILPRHSDWLKFFSNLKLVVVDEVHYYRGVFGSHMANILRRLRRIASYYDSNPIFVFCSATIANPDKHCKTLLGLDVKAITEDSSPTPPKKFVLWNPPLIGAIERRSPNIEAAEGIIWLAKKGLRTIAFTKARKTAELIARYVKDSDDISIAPYRAGYTPSERRKIEQKLFKGELQAVVATRALELGIDIGFLDACVLVGYPGSIASTFQMAGRAGRKQEGLVILIAGEDTIDQFLMRHPEYLFKTPPEEAICDPQNPYILKDHLSCAIFELPLEDDAIGMFGDNAQAVLEELLREGKISKLGKKWVWRAGGYPPDEVDIRSIREDEFDIIDISKGGKLIGTEEGIRAFKTIHEGAIYLYQGESYLVYELDLKNRKAYVAPTEADYYTEAISTTEISVLDILEVSTLASNPLVSRGFANVEVAETVYAYRMKKLYTNEVLRVVPLDLPTITFKTQAMFILVPLEIESKIKKEYDFPGALHALEHASIGVLPLLAMCDRMDIGGVSTPFHPDTSSPTIFIYDAYPGGVGIAKRGYERCDELLKLTMQVVSECPCQEGCPACVLSPKCGNNNQPMDKAGAIALVSALLTPR
ncbi:DEAD/DEAH box helicase [bacterium]|nr:DEAD/DEAH box helicase [bacterium]